MDFIVFDSKHIPDYLEYVPGREMVVQAGGNVGVYPKALAKFFNHVHTFEPDRENFACLERNIGTENNVTLWPYPLAASVTEVGMEKHPINKGMHRVVEGFGFQTMTIDQLKLESCDLIWLDVEYYERNVLIGAAETIKKFSPVIIVEGKKAFKYLSRLGYKKAANCHRYDSLWIR